MVGMWDVEYVGCLGCGMFGMCNDWNVECLQCVTLGMCDVRHV